MPEEKKGRMAKTYSKPKEKAALPTRGQRTATNKARKGTGKAPKTPRMGG
jgi:hypothetical protein